MYCCLPTELQRKLSKQLKVTYIIMIMYDVTPMIPLYNGSYLFPLSRAVNSNRLIFDPSEVEIHQYTNTPTQSDAHLNLVSAQCWGHYGPASETSFECCCAGGLIMAAFRC